jgi:hypothetical protein
MALNIDTNVEDIAVLVAKGISADLKKRIEHELHLHVDPMISELARDLANATVIRMEGYQTYDQMGPQIRVQLVFNNSDVEYVAGRIADGVESVPGSPGKMRTVSHVGNTLSSGPK